MVRVSKEEVEDDEEKEEEEEERRGCLLGCPDSCWGRR